MNKNIAIKFLILLFICAGLYSAFWFFKLGQTQKQINNFIAENGANISAKEVAVSGFPMAQKIKITELKFTIPNPALNKYQISIMNFEAEAGIFSSEFVTKKVEQVSIQEGSETPRAVEFAKEPEVKFAFSDGIVSLFSYQDSGYQILGADKNISYAASSSAIEVSSKKESDKTVFKISVNIKDSQGFDIVDIYRNSSEKKIIESIKTGQITLGNSAISSTPTTPTAVAQSTTTQPATPAMPTQEEDPSKNLSSAVSSSNIIKSNIIADAEYILSSGTQDVLAPIPGNEPSQIQEAPSQYGKSIKLNSFEFSNPLYKLIANGEINILQDDNMPSGALTVRIEKVDNLLNYVAESFTKLSQVTAPKPVDAQKPADAAASATATASTAPQPAVAPAAPTPATDQTAAANTAPPVTATTPEAPKAPEAIATASAENLDATDPAYQQFLQKIASGLNPVAKELATKNPVSKDDVAVFDIRREKNLEVLVNETPAREILGKF